MKVNEYYSILGKTTQDIQSNSLGNNDLELLSSNHSFLHDFASWLDVLEDRPEIDIFKNAIKEYQIGILSNNLGLYQQAFMALRFFLERTLVAILFSANEIELNLWKIGERDTYWTELMDKDKGIFSPKFCRAFFPDLKSEVTHFSAITSKVYRECSEYVHGNQTIIEKLPQSLEYSKELFYEWNEKADVIRRIILFSFCLRYLKSMSTDNINKIENSIADEFKSITQINQLIPR